MHMPGQPLSVQLPAVIGSCSQVVIDLESDGIEKKLSLGITVKYHLASHMMPNSNPRHRFFLSHPHTHDRFL